MALKDWSTKSILLGTAAFVAVFFVVVFTFTGGPPNGGPAAAPEPAASKKAITIDKSPSKQRGRADLIKEFQQKGVISKVEPSDGALGKYVEVTIRPAFYALDFETKQSFVSVIYAFYCEGNEGDAVFLKDSLTGKRAGTYTSIIGGLAMD